MITPRLVSVIVVDDACLAVPVRQGAQVASRILSREISREHCFSLKF